MLQDLERQLADLEAQKSSAWASFGMATTERGLAYSLCQLVGVGSDHQKHVDPNKSPSANMHMMLPLLQTTCLGQGSCLGGLGQRDAVTGFLTAFRSVSF